MKLDILDYVRRLGTPEERLRHLVGRLRYRGGWEGEAYRDESSVALAVWRELQSLAREHPELTRTVFLDGFESRPYVPRVKRMQALIDLGLADQAALDAARAGVRP